MAEVDMGATVYGVMAERDPRNQRERRGAGPAGLRERLVAGGPLVLDGALGTEIERRGGDAGLPLWSARALLEDPELVARIHREYVEAGAEILVADTFRTQARSLAHAGCGDRARELCALAVRLAREAAERAPGPCWVAGSAPPLADCYRPDLVPVSDALRREHAAHAGNLVAAGVDLVFVETMNTLREARAALAAAREAGAEAVASFVCGEGARLLSGEPLARALEALAPLAPLAVGVNCLPPHAAAACLPALASCGLPFLVYANLGAPAPDGGFVRSDELAPEAFADEAARWLEAGACAVGGCCGTTPAHVAAVAKRVSIRRGVRTQIASPRA
jgi:S-methylmethionine-dependent homocysteine/selenocysteine methylase